MELCKAKQIHNCCHPNALMTLEEFLTDYASSDTKAIGEKLIEQELKTFPPKLADAIRGRLDKIRNNQGNDFYF